MSTNAQAPPRKLVRAILTNTWAVSTIEPSFAAIYRNTVCGTWNRSPSFLAMPLLMDL
jgi:hypothetical protein